VVALKAWRLVHSRWAKTAFSGQGAALYPGRWNKTGERMVYLGSSLALAALETLVHLEVDATEEPFTAIELFIPDHLVTKRENLKRIWKDDLTYTRNLGSLWLKNAESLTLVVPSAVIGVETNLLLNPEHPAIGELKEVQRISFEWDTRLF
jgi:RES domain-containing protein